MEDVVISSYSTGGGPGDIPIESVTLNYAIVTYKYIPQDADGKAQGVQPVKHDLVKREVS